MASAGVWLGMAGGSKHNLLRTNLDGYYCKDDKISENWCFFDIPYFDVFKRIAGA